MLLLTRLSRFQELSLDLESHKNIIMSLNVVVNHVAEHALAADQRAADRLRNRLANANKRWDAVCATAGKIQGKLQTALLQVNFSSSEETFQETSRALNLVVE